MKKFLNSAKELPDFSERSDILALKREELGKVEVASQRYNPVLTYDGITKNPRYRQKPRRQLEVQYKKP
jgi:hypothetical protein